jgi:hypothetical protein
MAASRLRLNASKTEVIWLGSRHQLDTILINDVPVLSFPVLIAHIARDLGVVFNRELTLAAYITAKCEAGYYQLR